MKIRVIKSQLEKLYQEATFAYFKNDKVYALQCEREIKRLTEYLQQMEGGEKYENTTTSNKHI